MMRKLAVCLAVVARAAVAGAQAGGAAPTAPTAQPSPPPVKVGILQRDLAIAFSNEGQRDFGAMQKRFEARRVELTNLNNELEELKKQFNTQGDKMNDEARLNLTRSIQQKQKELNRGQEDFREDVAMQQQEIAGRIYSKMLQTVDRYAKQNGFAVVLNYDQGNAQEQILWAGQSVDITRAVVDAYNIESGVPAPPPPPPTAPSASRPGTGGATSPGAPARPAGTTPPKPSGSNPPR